MGARSWVLVEVGGRFISVYRLALGVVGRLWRFLTPCTRFWRRTIAVIARAVSAPKMVKEGACAAGLAPERRA